MAGGSGEIDAFLAFGKPMKGGPAIDGETLDVIERKAEDGLGKSIQIKGYQTNFKLNTTNTEETHSQAGDAVAPTFEAKEFTITKIVDSASPALLNALRCATRYTRVLISQRKAGGVKGRSGDYFWLIELKNVLISSLTWNADESGPTTETMILTYYDEITVEYYKQKPTGELEQSPAWITIPLEEALKSKNGKDDTAADLSESQVQSVVKRVVQAIKKGNPSLNIKA
jgi:type VI protein secretion system component Hcp